MTLGLLRFQLMLQEIAAMGIVMAMPVGVEMPVVPHDKHCSKIKLCVCGCDYVLYKFGRRC